MMKMKWNFILIKTREKEDKAIKEKEQKDHEWVIQIEHALQDFKMKKKDIIRLVKEAIKETTFYGNRHQRSSISGLPGVMEDEDLKEFTDYGQEGIYPKKEKPGDMFQQKEVEDMFPNGMASRSDKAFQAKLKQHADWTEQSAYNNTFVHMQYHETKGLEDEYFIYQTQHYNGNYDDFRNPKFTKLSITKNKGKENEEDLGEYIVDTNAYIEDLKTLEDRGVLGKRVMEMHDFEKKYGDKIDADNFKNNPKLQPGKIVLYGGTRYEVQENNGFILKLKSVESGKTTTVNLGQFNKQGAMKEKDMKEALTVSKLTNKSKAAQLAKAANTTVTAVQDAIDAAKKTGEDQTVAEDEMNEEPKEYNMDLMRYHGGDRDRAAIDAYEKEYKKTDEISYDDAKKKGLDNPDKADISKDKDISDYELKRGMAIQKAMDDQEKNEGHMELTNDIGKDDYMDDEGRMAKSQLYKAGKYAMKLHDMLDDMEQLPSWVQAKLTKASDYMSMVYHYLDYEFARRDSNLMEYVDKYKKRATLMEGAMKKFFEMFDKGMTDEEVVLDYAQKGTQVPETFVGKARKQYEGIKRMKLELEMSEKEYKNSASKMVSNADEGMEPSMEEKKLSSGLSK